jgi:hypothetical protein
MAEQKEVAKQKIQVKNTGKAPHVLHAASGEAKVIGPGQEAEVEVAEPQAKILQEASKRGSHLTVSGHEPEKEEPSEVETATPEEQKSRHALAEKETELMQAGQEAGKDAREKMAKKDWQKLAAETGIGIMGRGGVDALETVAEAPDAPAKKK